MSTKAWRRPLATTKSASEGSPSPHQCLPAGKLDDLGLTGEAGKCRGGNARKQLDPPEQFLNAAVTGQRHASLPAGDNT